MFTTKGFIVNDTLVPLNIKLLELRDSFQVAAQRTFKPPILFLKNYLDALYKGKHKPIITKFLNVGFSSAPFLLGKRILEEMIQKIR